MQIFKAEIHSNANESAALPYANSALDADHAFHSHFRLYFCAQLKDEGGYFGCSRH